TDRSDTEKVVTVFLKISSVFQDETVSFDSHGIAKGLTVLWIPALLLDTRFYRPSTSCNIQAMVLSLTQRLSGEHVEMESKGVRTFSGKYAYLVSPGAFTGLGPNIKSLYLEKNRMYNLPNLHGFTALEIINLNDIPFSCDCRLLPLRKQVINSQYSSSKIENLSFFMWLDNLNLRVGATCGSPPNRNKIRDHAMSNSPQDFNIFFKSFSKLLLLNTFEEVLDLACVASIFETVGVPSFDFEVGSFLSPLYSAEQINKFCLVIKMKQRYFLYNMDFTLLEFDVYSMLVKELSLNHSTYKTLE
ncbi:putative Ran GTPase-activating protein, partial [Naja naja]